jgi:SAM-dependent methyltransferase
VSFISMRRYYLDKILCDGGLEFKGTVLDIGGQRVNRRGRFQIPENKLGSWMTLNSNPDHEPDIVCELPEIKCDDLSVDTVLMTETIEYIFDVEALLKEIHRVLKDGGRFYLSAPLFNPIHGDHQTDYYRFTESFYRKLFENRFKIVECQRMGGIVAVVYDMLRVYLGYGDKSFFKSACGKILRAFSSVALLLDRCTLSGNFYTNTGYWFVLEKL